MEKEIYPKMITELPEVDISLKGVKGWLLQGIDKQVVFFDIEPDASIPEHSHGEQWVSWSTENQSLLWMVLRRYVERAIPIIFQQGLSIL